MDKLIFINKNWPSDPHIRLLKPTNFAFACEIKSKLMAQLEAKFEDEIKDEFFQTCMNLYNFPFFLYGIGCPCSKC